MNRNELVDRCKAVIKDAYEEATEMIVAYLELHQGEQRQSLAKEIDPENWQALDSRIRRRQAARKASGEAESSPSGSEPEWKKSKRRKTKQTLREEPEIVAELSPAEQRELAKQLDTESAKREHERKQVAKAKERAHLGDETVDDLELRETLQSTEYLLIKARGELRGFVKAGGEIGIENTPQAWRESCLDWIDDLEGHLGMAKALLTGDDVDWTKFEEMLEREAN